MFWAKMFKFWVVDARVGRFSEVSLLTQHPDLWEGKSTCAKFKELLENVVMMFVAKQVTFIFILF